MRSRSATRRWISAASTSIRATSPWCRTRTCANPIAFTAASAASIWRSAPTVTGVPCGMRDERQAKDGLFQLGRPSARAAARISAFAIPASSRGKRTPRRTADACPGRWSPASSAVAPYARCARPSSVRTGSRVSNSSSLQWKQRSGWLRAEASSSTSPVVTSTRGGPSGRASSRAADCPDSGYAAELASTATAPSRSSSMARRSSSVESTPPEYATSTEPRSRTRRRAPSSRIVSNESSWIINPVPRLACARLRRLHRRRAAPRLVVDQAVHRRVLSAQRAGLVLAQLELAEAHVLALEQQVAAYHRTPDVQQVLDRLEGHHAADDPGQDAKHARLGAALHAARRRRLGEQAAVAAGALGRVEQRQPALEPEDAAVLEGLGQEVRRVVGEVAGREVVGAVDDHVVGREDAHRRLRVEVLVDGHDLDVGVQVAQRLRRRFDLGPADVVVSVEQLALEVGGVDDVEVDDADLADAGRRQVHGRR